MTATIRRQPGQLNLRRRFIRAINPLVVFLLTSPLHFLVSKWFMVLNVTGRKTGTVYRIPVQYYQQGHVLMVITSRDYRWWRNLIDGTLVEVNLRGKTVKGHTSISLNPDVIINIFGKMYPSTEFNTREHVAENSVLVYVTL